MIKKETIMDILFWTAMGILATWTVLKVLGLINSPVLIEAIPNATVLFIAGMIWEKMKNLSNEVRLIKEDVRDIYTRIENIDKRLYGLEKEHSLVMKNARIEGHKI